MAVDPKYVWWLEPDDVSPSADLIGNKALGILKLMKLTHLGFKVPEGFVVTTDVYNRMLKLESMKLEIENRRVKKRSTPKYLSVYLNERTSEIARTSRIIQKGLLQRRLAPANRPDAYDFLLEVVSPAYKKLCKLSGVDDLGVAVRSSAVYEDLRERSYAGSYESYLNVKGERSLVNSILKCFAYAWEKHLFKDRQNQVIPIQASIAFLIQKVVCPDVAGVTFTADPVSGNLNKICINSAWGLGDVVVSGKVTGDVFCVDKKTLQIEHSRIAEKKVASRCGNAGDTYLESIPPEMIFVPSLTEENVFRVAKICRDIENEMRFPVDIEWAFHKNSLYLLQVRPITTI